MHSNTKTECSFITPELEVFLCSQSRIVTNLSVANVFNLHGEFVHFYIFTSLNDKSEYLFYFVCFTTSFVCLATC